jgi:hypothetical protein
MKNTLALFFFAPALLLASSIHSKAAEINDGGGDYTTYDRFQNWTRENPDTWTGIQGGLNNLNRDTPQSNVLQGAGEALGAGIGQTLYPPAARHPRPR